MSEAPIPADSKPATLELKAGFYFWCTCGRSKNQPFCDGGHRGTGVVPMRFEVKEDATLSLCQCKQTGTKPFCDGSHASL